MTLSSKSIKFSRKNVKSNFYYIAFAIIVLGFGIFFNSKHIMPDTTQLYNTSIGQQFHIGDLNIYLNRWEYNQNKNFMEIELRYSETDDSLNSKLDFSAVAKVNTSKKLQIETVVKTDNTYILHIENVPKNYGAICIKVLENDDSDSSSNSKISLYCDYRKVKINNTLKIQSEKDYLIKITKEDIKSYENKISEDNKIIAKNKVKMDEINKNINDLDSQYKYEIKDEQQKTTQKINDLQNKITQINKENDDLFSTENNDYEKIGKLKLKLSDLSK